MDLCSYTLPFITSVKSSSGHPSHLSRQSLNARLSPFRCRPFTTSESTSCVCTKKLKLSNLLKMAPSQKLTWHTTALEAIHGTDLSGEKCVGVQATVASALSPGVIVNLIGGFQVRQ